MTNIVLTEKATVSAEGKHRNGNTKPVMCITTGEVYTSVTDAAEKNNTTLQNMSVCIRRQRKLRSGKRFCFVSEVNEHLEEMTSNLKTMATKYAELEAKAAAYDAWMAEQEAKRKAEEKRQARIADLSEKLERRRANCELLEAKLQKETAKFMKIENELKMLQEGESA